MESSLEKRRRVEEQDDGDQPPLKKSCPGIKGIPCRHRGYVTKNKTNDNYTKLCDNCRGPAYIAKKKAKAAAKIPSNAGDPVEDVVSLADVMATPMPLFITPILVTSIRNFCASHNRLDLAEFLDDFKGDLRLRGEFIQSPEGISAFQSGHTKFVVALTHGEFGDRKKACDKFLRIGKALDRSEENKNMVDNGNVERSRPRYELPQFPDFKETAGG